MSYLAVEVEIDHGRVLPRGPDALPEKGSGLLTILALASRAETASKTLRPQVELPLIRGGRWRLINPTSEELDARLWGD